MTGRSRRRRPPRTHPYTPSGLIPADHNGLKPCICGRAKANAVHNHKAVADVDAAQAAHLRRYGDDQ
ncbi:hypothetical protein CSH63_24935 [Micromonospora tulbaghiae]|uniref:Uncharacterized protein n=1 Tax=Micromonospora tulbaghiae TaxID=479978 RepID=A0A386WTA2_9ACTN|nr:hypothetical protein [Micromonospora tulbaghiae]AYF30630.1 hypothetical protein CSH63_24935 [Micromonospora tulbaghiae]